MLATYIQSAASGNRWSCMLIQVVVLVVVLVVVVAILSVPSVISLLLFGTSKRASSSYTCSYSPVLLIGVLAVNIRRHQEDHVTNSHTFTIVNSGPMLQQAGCFAILKFLQGGFDLILRSGSWTGYVWITQQLCWMVLQEDGLPAG